MPRTPPKSVSSLVIACLLGTGAPISRAELPVPCGGGACSGGPSVWVSSGQALSNINGSTLEIHQQSDRAILNWATFNVGAGEGVKFDQPSASSVALNRIFDQRPSDILGTIDANGQIYLINPNGFLFGSGARVNTNTLIASTLDVKDAIFNGAGIGQAINQDAGAAAFEGNSLGTITIESGAQIDAQAGGRVFIFGSEIFNRGEIHTPDGQAVLAASRDKVYLQASNDPLLRGFFVEVGTGGSVDNLGQIVAERGNVTLAGLAVNQGGLVTATTSLQSAGSVRLLARDSASIERVGNNNVLIPERSGTLTLAPDSVTEVRPDPTATELAVDDQPQLHSRIELMGREVRIGERARVEAKSGTISAVATANPRIAAGDPNAPIAANVPQNDSRLVIEPGAVLDVSGVDDAVLPMSRNVVAVELRANELADAPLQRDGVLRGATVKVDVRKGTPLANVTAAINSVQRGLSERLSTGGTIQLASEGDVVVGDGARLDISGGQVRYETGVLDTTRLLSHGKVVDIGSADPTQQYDGFASGVSVAYKRWGVTETFSGLAGDSGAQIQPGYVEGKDAGMLQITAHDAVIAGVIDGHVTQGQWQRDPTQSLDGKPAFDRPYDQLADAGSLLLNLGPAASTLRDVTLSTVGESSAAFLHTAPAVDHRLLLPIALLGGSGLGSIAVATNGALTSDADADLDLSGGASLDLRGGTVDLAGDIRIPSGHVSVRSGRTGVVENAPLRIRDGVVIDTSGAWINDVLSRTGTAGGGDPVLAPILIDGGSIDILAQGDLRIGPRAILNVSGGGQYGLDETVTGGAGGSVSVTSQSIGGPTQFLLDAIFLGYGLDRGGSLSLSGNEVFVAPPQVPQPFPPAGEPDPTARPPLVVDPSLFRNFGFENIALTANRGDLVVLPGTQIAPQLRNLVLDNDFLQHATGDALLSFASVAAKPADVRRPVNVALNAVRVADVELPTALRIDAGATIDLDPGARLDLTTNTQAIIGGRIRAPGGDVSARIVTTSAGNFGFQNDQAIWLTPDASIDVSGVFVPAQSTVNYRGLTLGELIAGGKVTLAADRGSVVTLPGSTIDVSGIGQRRDVVQANGTVQRIDDYAAAGSIAIAAPENIFLQGALIGRPASTPGAAGGSLSIQFDPSTRNPPSEDFSYPSGSRQVVLAETFAPRDLQIGGAIAANGIAEVPVAGLEANGFDNLSVVVRNTDNGRGGVAVGSIQFSGDVALNLRDTVSLDAPVIALDGNVELGASYLSLGYRFIAAALERVFPAASGTLDAHANLIDLVGQVRIEGAQQVSLTSTGDMRLIGELPNDAARTLEGGLLTDAQLVLAADQIFPSSLTRFRIDQRRAGGSVEIRGSGDPLASVLSAGGAIEIDADRIIQGGTLKAPGGEILLTAADSLELTAGSSTSVSLDGETVLLGQTQGQLDWIYPLANSRSIVFDVNVADALSGVSRLPPEKSLALEAPRVAVANGATVDVSGGGTLLAYEFVPGPGGSRDILGEDNGSFAIVPTSGVGFGAFDTALFQGFQTPTGTGFELAGGGAIPSGTFAVMPARFALLPGAFLVTPSDAGRNVSAGSVSVGDDGIATVAGRFTRLGTPVTSATYSAFDVLTRDQVLARSEFALSSADTFFADRAQRTDQTVPRLPTDAGNVRFSVDDALSFLGTLRVGTGERGRGGAVDIEATNIRVAPSIDEALLQTVQITTDQLDALGAASLLLGGRRVRTVDGTRIDVAAERVDIAADSQVHAPDVIVAARDRIDVGEGALVQAVLPAGGRSGAPVGDGGAITVNGDAAIVRVTTDADVIQRSQLVGATGSIGIAAGARLEAPGTVQIDAPLDVALLGAVSAPGGTLALGASRIALTDFEQALPGLVLSADKIGGSGATDLLLRSGSSVDVDGGFALDVGMLSIDAAGLIARTDGASSFTANVFTLGNSSGAAADAAVVAHAADLTITAQQWVLGGGANALSGFQRVSGVFGDRVVAADDAAIAVSGDLDIATPLLLAARGARMTLDVAGTAALTGGTGDATATTPLESLGGSVAIAADRIRIDTRVMARAGNIAATARSADADALVVDAAGILDVAGLDVGLGGRAVSVAGGAVVLDSGGGAVLRPGALIDVGGSAAGGDAGRLSVATTSGWVLGGTLAAGHAATALGGSVSVSQDAALDLPMLADAFAAAGFSHEISLTAGAGDLTLDVGRSLSADHVRLVADAGSIDAAGAVIGTGEQGSVELDARDAFTLRSGAIVRANDRVSINVADPEGTLRLESGSALDVSSSTGEVRLRVARGGTPLDTRVTLDGALPTRGNTVLEAVAVVNDADGVVTASETAGWFNDLAAFMGGSDALVTALGQSANGSFSIRPGLEIRSAGDLRLAQGWDLSGWRFGDAPGSLVLRAGGQLTIGGDLSDGAVQDFDPLSGDPFDRLLTGRSWDLTLVGGADLASAQVTRTAALGDVVIGSGVRVRTGTGQITAAAGRDVRLTDAGSAIYTMGMSTGVGPWPDLYAELLLPKFEFPTDGGDISITAARDVLGAKTPQLVSQWMVRLGGDAGDSDFPTTYGVLPGLFRENVGSLGGGNIQVAAARDVRDLSVVLPVTAQHAGDVALIDGTTDLSFTDNSTLIQGGGDMSMTAGRDVIGGFVYLGKGTGTVRAGGAVRPEAPGIRGLLVGLADATIDIAAIGLAHLEAALNPTVLPEAVDHIGNPAFYFTYAPDAAVSVTSVTRDAVLGNDLLAISRSTDLRFSGPGGNRALNLYPGTVAAVSLLGDVRLGQANASDANFALFPSQSGGLTLLAHGNVISGDNAAVEVNVSDADPALLPNVDRVATSLQETLLRVPQRGTAFQQSDRVHAPVPIHTGDGQGSLVVAQEGDIRGEQLVFVFPEQAELHAGRDIRIDQAFLQNVAPGDVSVLEAGRDIKLEARRDPETGNVSNSQSVILASGPGRLDVLAGRDLDLGTSEGILSVGNLVNPGLVSGGAALSLFAGVAPGVDYAGFTDAVILADAAYRDKLTQYVRALRGDASLTTDQAIAAFAALPVEDQRPLVLDVFFDELKNSGRDNANDPSVGFDRGFAAIHSLFPEDRAYQGDFTLFFSRAQTQDGGDINILVPGGLVNAGLTATFSGAKTPDQLGVVAQRAGSVNAFVKDDFQVNQSRVFALDGGDIVIWSSDGNIDAGRGAKTALAAPQPRVTFDANGNVVVEFPPAISGSGIRNAVSTPGRKPGDVFLIAPTGIVNAGDAGIGVAGNLIVAAQQVIGTENISVGGQAFGVSLDTGGLAAGLSGVSNAGASATNAAEETIASNDSSNATTSIADTSLGWLEVFLEGYGEPDKDCDPEKDPNCHAKVQ